MKDRFSSSLFIVCHRFHPFKTKVKHVKCFKTLCVIDDYALKVFAVTGLIAINLLTKQSTSRQR